MSTLGSDPLSRAALEQCGPCVLVVDWDLRVLLFNPACAGTPGRDVALGADAPASLATSEDEGHALRSMMNWALQGERVQVRLGDASSEAGGYDVQIVPLRGPTGAIEGAVVTLHEVHEPTRYLPARDVLRARSRT